MSEERNPMTPERWAEIFKINSGGHAVAIRPIEDHIFQLHRAIRDLRAEVRRLEGEKIAMARTVNKTLGISNA